MKLADYDRCSGCAACANVCARSAIRMIPTATGFLVPYIDDAICCGCGACQRVCPVFDSVESSRPISVLAAKAQDSEIRMNSSSGGIFTLLARETLRNKGVVYGAAIRASDKMVSHIFVESDDELTALRGSKYIQSEIGNIYQSVKERLLQGRNVLFSGTPCQIHGLRKFLGRSYDNLLCVDIICHGVPSPLAWKKYLESRSLALMGRSDVLPNGISFRNKQHGWRQYSLSLCYSRDEDYLGPVYADPFFKGFLSDLFNRPSCSRCSSRDGRSGADITLADYWRVWEKFPDFDDDTGVSLVLVRTKHGLEALDSIRREIFLRESTYDDAVRVNPSLVHDCAMHPKYARFFQMIKEGRPFDIIVQHLLRRSLWRRICSRCLRYLRKLFGYV